MTRAQSKSLASGSQQAVQPPRLKHNFGGERIMRSPSRNSRAVLTACLLCISLIASQSALAQAVSSKGGATRKGSAGAAQAGVPEPAAPQVVFSNPAAITINDAMGGSPPTPGTPYPSNITLSALAANVSQATLTHT